MGSGRLSRERKLERRDEPPVVEERRCDFEEDDGGFDNADVVGLSSPLLPSRVDAAVRVASSGAAAMVVDDLGVPDEAGALAAAVLGREGVDDEERGFFIPDF